MMSCRIPGTGARCKRCVDVVICFRHLFPLVLISKNGLLTWNDREQHLQNQPAEAEPQSRGDEGEMSRALASK
jgi:hypothetical protein